MTLRRVRVNKQFALLPGAVLMNSSKRLIQSTLGKKIIMAVSGLALFGFAAGHMVGNLQVFLGPETINRYGHFLQSNRELLWGVRISLLTLLVLHVWAAIRVTLENRRARGSEPYAGASAPFAASYASRTMFMGGLMVAVFIVYHLLHYTVRVPAINLTGQDFTTLKEVLPNGESRHDVYAMMIRGFSHPLVSVFYLIGVGLLTLHLSHGIRAMFQSLGLKNGVWGPWIDRLAPWVAGVLFLGYASIPLAVLLGILK